MIHHGSDYSDNIRAPLLKHHFPAASSLGYILGTFSLNPTPYTWLCYMGIRGAAWASLIVTVYLWAAFYYYQDFSMGKSLVSLPWFAASLPGLPLFAIQACRLRRATGTRQCEKRSLLFVRYQQ
jgi:hypothetical protein